MSAKREARPDVARDLRGELVEEETLEQVLVCLFIVRSIWPSLNLPTE
jgi:hypothetical protein